MSNTATENTPTTPAVEAEVVNDGSIVAEGQESALKTLATKARAAWIETIDFSGKMIGSAKKAAVAEAKARLLVRLPDGHPDWAGDTMTYRLYVSNVRDEAFEGKDEDAVKRARNAVRQAMRRGTKSSLSPLDSLIVEYVKAHYQGFDKIEVTNEVEAASAPAAFRKRVRQQYERQPVEKGKGHGVPEHWDKVTGTGQGAGPSVSAGEANEASFVAAVSQAVDVIDAGKASQGATLDATLRIVSETAEFFLAMKDSDVRERPALQAKAERVRDISILLALRLDGKLAPEQRETFEALRWNPERDDS